MCTRKQADLYVLLLFLDGWLFLGECGCDESSCWYDRRAFGEVRGERRSWPRAFLGRRQSCARTRKQGGSTVEDRCCSIRCCSIPCSSCRRSTVVWPPHPLDQVSRQAFVAPSKGLATFPARCASSAFSVGSSAAFGSWCAAIQPREAHPIDTRGSGRDQLRCRLPVRRLKRDCERRF